jgi:hypothetical protein
MGREGGEEVSCKLATQGRGGEEKRQVANLPYRAEAEWALKV